MKQNLRRDQNTLEVHNADMGFYNINLNGKKGFARKFDMN